MIKLAVSSLLPSIFSRMHNLSYLQKMISTQIQNSSYPSSTLVEMTEMYGCHCNSNRSQLSVGPVLDDYDKLCSDLAMCHQCILFDFPDYKYEPVTRPYDWVLNSKVGKTPNFFKNTLI